MPIPRKGSIKLDEELDMYIKNYIRQDMVSVTAATKINILWKPSGDFPNILGGETASWKKQHLSRFPNGVSTKY